MDCGCSERIELVEKKKDCETTRDASVMIAFVFFALSFCIILVLAGIGYTVHRQHRENAMLSDIQQNEGKPAAHAVAALKNLGYRVAVEEQLYGPRHTTKDYDILLLTNNGTVIGGTTD